MKLIITEKPSVAQSIAKVLGINNRKKGYLHNDEYIISWCIGHLVSLAEPESYDDKYKNWHNLPILPESWNYNIKSATKEQFEVLKALMNNNKVDSVICATDAGREGELIFRHVYNMARCKKPFLRLWISSMEDSAILNGFSNLKQGSDYDNLYNSALCRERADWIVGMNATRFFTTAYNSTNVLSVGRVQTPTLAMIVQRDNDIKNFIKEKYYTVVLDCGNFKATSDKINDLSLAEKIKNNCTTAVVTSVTQEEKKVNPPKLYDLTTLQRDANRHFAFTAQQTLESVQRLYDNKLATYPRTDSQYLTEDMEDTAKEIIGIIKNKFDFAKSDFQPNIKVVMNNKKVSDHHAIIPTASIEKADLSSLTDTDKKILYLIACRLITATAEKHIYTSTVIKLDSNNTTFTATGKTITVNGFKTVEENFKTFVKSSDNEQTKEEKILPNVKEAQSFNVTSEIAEHYTQPPKPYTEDTLLSAMERAGNADYDTDEVERKGLGTPATRANIIETLIKRGYVERNKKQLISSEKGKTVVNAVPDSIKSAKLTAEWENRLVLVSKGEADSILFMNDIFEFVKSIISETKPITEVQNVFDEREVIGICPRCKNKVFEGKLNFYCENKDCQFALWRKNKFWESKGKEITKANAKALLKNGKVHFKDLYSPTKDKNYEADILLDDTGGKYVNFKLEFSQTKKEG